MSATTVTHLELLAPARDAAIGRLAVTHGADAVYIGAEAFGARASAGNSVDDIAGLADFAHTYNAKVYVTLNTLIYDSELAAAETLIRRLYAAGADALIVQDLGVLRMDIPPIALHASTQCDIRTPEKARFLQDCGFSQLVLPRELSSDEIRSIRAAVDIPLEAFVHGALCVSYSGDCQASLLATGRSANRGECAQMCRLPYTLTDAHGRQVAPAAHYLSLRDLNRLDRLDDMIDAGVTSFKIEGRLKDSAYVRNTVASYSQALDRIADASSGRFARSSHGKASIGFTPDVDKSFNRRFTSYFLDGRPSCGKASRMASLESPKWIGSPVATVVSVQGRRIRIKPSEPLSNGDGLGYFDPDNRYCGFRLNKIDGDVITAASDVALQIGDTLYRNRDKRRDDMMEGTTATRTISVDATLRQVDSSHIALALADSHGNEIEVTAGATIEQARSPQTGQRRNCVSKLGDTVYILRQFTDTIPSDLFIPASVLTPLRRDAAKALTSARRARYAYDYRRPEASVPKPFKPVLDRHDNVANRLAEYFYRSHGFEISAKAAEVQKPDTAAPHTVMTTRYCLRRELGACLKTPDASKLPASLHLTAPGVRYRLDFDCNRCMMKVVAEPQ